MPDAKGAEMERRIGIIGGSGLYAIDGLSAQRWERIETPWGAPSDQILLGEIDGVGMAFLPRHGRGHRLSPASVPYRANIAALKMLGVREIVSMSACGSFREELAPGDFVIVDQFIDRTAGRAASFFGTGCVAHVSLAAPTCARLGDSCADAAEAAGAKVHRGGVYLAIEGPQFSTRAESELYRHWGCDVVGMTNMPEARLAREAEICYASVAMVTDYDCWHDGHGAVDVATVVAVLGANAARARATVAALPARLAPVATCPCGCDRALDNAIITAPEARDAAMVAQLRSIAGRVLGS
jgi:5'-methylthioadenosine phosphorylase